MSVDQNIHNSETGHTFDLIRTNKSILQVQQLVAIARRRRAANVDQSDALVEQYNLQDLLRTADLYTSSAR